MTAGTVDYMFPAEAEAIRAALSQVRSHLSRTGLSDAMQARVELVLAEVLNNIARHAYAEATDGSVGLSLRQGKAGLTVAVTDDGIALPGVTLPDGALPDLDVPQSALPEGGFGWHIIRSETDALRYGRRNGVNRLVLSFRGETGA